MAPHRQLVLMRAINLAAVNRVPMAALRDAANAAGFGGADGARTYLQSGNLVLESGLDPARLAAEIEALVLERFGVSSRAVVRSAEQLTQLIEHNPFPLAAAEHPKQYQLTFLSEPCPESARARIADLARGADAVALSPAGTEIYAWHPGGIHVSQLAAELSDKKLGVGTATSRNWTTVLACSRLLDG